MAAINPPALLVWLIWMAIGLMLSTYCIPLLAGLYRKRANGQGAVWSITAGLAGFFFQKRQARSAAQ